MTSFEKMMTRAATVAVMAIAATSSLRADTNTNSAVGTGKDVKAPVVPAATPASPLFNYTFTEEYDSRYMFRGVNVLPNTGILWTEFDPVWHITANDNLSVPLAYGVALGKTYTAGLENYRELDVPVSYTHAIGNWTLGAGYQLYAYFNLPGYHPGGQGIQNEVNANVSYTLKTGIVTWTPAVFYYYELGTAVPYNYGSVYAGSSFLSPQLTASVPLNADGSITFNPNLQYNFSFKYNANYLGDAYTGANNVQIQAPLTWQITKIVSVTGYVAYSYTGANLAGTGGRTSPSTVWAGANVTLSF